MPDKSCICWWVVWDPTSILTDCGRNGTKCGCKCLHSQAALARGSCGYFVNYLLGH